jgi:hypothetical protein
MGKKKLVCLSQLRFYQVKESKFMAAVMWFIGAMVAVSILNVASTIHKREKCLEHPASLACANMAGFKK